MTFAALMLAGAIPTGLAGTVTNATGFLVLRCFTGILAGGLVPCEVWCMGFFDKNVVGTANALAAGWANMGSGLTYYAMPAIFDSLVKHRGLTPHAAWRVSFIIPTILVISVAILMLVFGEDSPTGPWSERQRALNQQLRTRDLFVSTVKRRQGSDPRSNACSDDKIELNASEQTTDDIENPVKDEQDLITAMSWELVQKPSVTQSARAVFSIHAFVLFSMYFCSLGIELTLVSILGAYYYEKFPPLGQTLSGDWASMFGFLDLVSRPAGGIISDAFFRSTGSLWSRKMWFHFLLLVAGVFACVIGFTSPDSKANLFGLMVGLAFFAEAGNGAVFALVPHVYPASNGKLCSPKVRCQRISPGLTRFARRCHIRFHRRSRLSRHRRFPTHRPLQWRQLFQDRVDNRGMGHQHTGPYLLHSTDIEATAGWAVASDWVQR